MRENNTVEKCADHDSNLGYWHYSPLLYQLRYPAWHPYCYMLVKLHMYHKIYYLHEPQPCVKHATKGNSAIDKMNTYI